MAINGFYIVCGSLSLLSYDHAWLSCIRPVGMSLGALIVLALMIKSPSMIERFARLVEPDLPASGVQWTRQVPPKFGVFFCNALCAFVQLCFYLNSGLGHL